MQRLLLLLVLAAAFSGSAGGPAVAQDRGTASATLQERIDAAPPGDTIIVQGGVFRERITIDKPLVLVGAGWPVIDGGGEGDVVTITADDVEVSGFIVRGSDKRFSQESAAIKVDGADRATIQGNRIGDSRFGIYLLDSEESIVANNEVVLDPDLPMGRRGYGIYLWTVSRTAVHGNTIRHASDGIHLEFSKGNGIGTNVVTESRYGLHLMYSPDNRVLNNTFRHNLAGAVLMFSHNLLLKDNEFSESRAGATGAGMLFKDCDNIFAEGNRMLRNKYGMTVEGTPQSMGATAVFRLNLFAQNDIGLGLMSNAPIIFVENALIDNAVQVKALGRELASGLLSSHGGSGHEEHGAGSSGQGAQGLPMAKGVVWSTEGRGNYWSDYPGYDADGDGIGDVPYQPLSLYASVTAKNPALQVFQYSPAQRALDLAGRLFPVFRPQPLLTDPAPLIKPPVFMGESARQVSWSLLVLSLLLVGAPMYAVWQQVLPRERGERASRLAA